MLGYDILYLCNSLRLGLRTVSIWDWEQHFILYKRIYHTPVAVGEQSIVVHS